MLNVKLVSKGWSKRLEDAFPFHNITEKRLEWTSEFVCGLKEGNSTMIRMEKGSSPRKHTCPCLTLLLLLFTLFINC